MLACHAVHTLTACCSTRVATSISIDCDVSGVRVKMFDQKIKILDGGNTHRTQYTREYLIGHKPFSQKL